MRVSLVRILNTNERTSSMHRSISRPQNNPLPGQVVKAENQKTRCWVSRSVDSHWMALMLFPTSILPPPSRLYLVVLCHISLNSSYRDQPCLFLISPVMFTKQAQNKPLPQIHRQFEFQGSSPSKKNTLAMFRTIRPRIHRGNIVFFSRLEFNVRTWMTTALNTKAPGGNNACSPMHTFSYHVVIVLSLTG